MADEILRVEDLSVSYGKGNMISGVNFTVTRGEIVCFLGESGCGKSTLLKAIMNIPELETVITKGDIIFEGRDITTYSNKEIRSMAGKNIGMVLQHLGGAFNPLRTFEAQFKEALSSHDMEYDFEKVKETFDRLNLPDPERIIKSRPYEMSGGMIQRIAIAVTMLLDPQLLLCDEPTSALDVTTQKKAVQQLMKMRDILNTTILLVTHNPGIPAMMADKVGVMYAGHLVEYGVTDKVLHSPAHPYTKALIGAIPTFNFELPKGLEGQPPLNGADMEDCAFAPRCELYKDGNCRCADDPYTLKEVDENRLSTCF